MLKLHTCSQACHITVQRRHLGIVDGVERLLLAPSASQAHVSSAHAVLTC